LGLDEAALVRSALEGSEKAYTQLMRIHKVSVYNLVLRMVQDRDDAADLTQETFIKAFRSLARFNPEFPFRSWVLKIASNTCLDFLRSRRPQHVSTEEVVIADPAEDPASRFASGRIRMRIEEAIKTLPENLRAAIVLRHQEGMSYEEIANALEVPIGTVKTWIKRGREMLKSRLGQ
jgi:RNA polymerase sigma-70 factor (ECF subfamily)